MNIWRCLLKGSLQVQKYHVGLCSSPVCLSKFHVNSCTASTTLAKSQVLLAKHSLVVLVSHVHFRLRSGQCRLSLIQIGCCYTIICDHNPVGSGPGHLRSENRDKALWLWSQADICALKGSILKTVKAKWMQLNKKTFENLFISNTKL